MPYRVSPAYREVEPPNIPYQSEDEEWRQRVWARIRSEKKVAQLFRNVMRVDGELLCTPVMERLVDDLVRAFEGNPTDRSPKERERYRGRLIPERRLYSKLLWSFRFWMEDYVRSVHRPTLGELSNSRKDGIPDPIQRVFDFLDMVREAVTQIQYMSPPEETGSWSRTATAHPRHIGGGRFG